MAQEVLRSGDFQQMLAQLGDRLRRELLQELVQQPLRQVGTAVGQDIQGALFSDGNDGRFAPSGSQVGALLQELIAGADEIL